LKHLIQEAHRRSLWQVLGIYVVGSWIALQVVDVLAQNMTLPDWVFPFALVLLVIGFPIVMATAFVQEGLSGQPSAEARAPAALPQGGDDEGGAERPGADVSRATEPVAADTKHRGTHHHIFTWRNAVLGGAAAFTLLGIVTAAWLVMRTAGIGPAATLIARGVLDQRDRVILAEFDSQTGDTLLARAATEALRVDLGQSQTVNVVEARYVAEVLARMERDPGGRLSQQLASEVAIREGIKALVAGEINAAGTGYVLTAKLLTADGKEVLASRRETAADASRIIEAIDKLSKGLRERIGDPLRALQRDEPLEQVTTSSLEALRMYSQAVNAIEVEGRPEKGIALLEEALALDSTFAMAWRKLGITLGNRGQETSRAMEALARAYEHRDRLTRVERFITMGSYYDKVTDETAKSIAAYENALEAHPDHPWALNNLALQYGELRQIESAEDLLRRAVRADSTSPLSYLNLAAYQWTLDDPEEARATLAVFAARFPGSPRADEFHAYFASSVGEYEEAIGHLEHLRQREARSLFWRAYTSAFLGSVAASQGKLAEAERHYRAAQATNEERGLDDQWLGNALDAAYLQAFVLGDAARAARMADSALDATPLSTMDPLDRPYLRAVVTYARAGRSARAREFLQEFEELELVGTIEDAERDLHWMTGAIALAEGRNEEAIKELRRAHDRAGGCLTCALPELAEAYAHAGAADSAVAVFGRYVDLRPAFRIWGDRYFLGPTYERLGQLHDERGDWEKAAEYYAKLVELWREADPELQPRVQAAQQRLEEIFAERG
jgi:tetratricopeptide (TPR) repeat protein